MSHKWSQYVNYIENAQNPTIEQFDDDWEPIGPLVRTDMKRAELIYERDGRVFNE